MVKDISHTDATFRNSIEFSKTTRGNTWTIKVYDDDTDRALEKIAKLNEELRARFEA